MPYTKKLLIEKFVRLIDDGYNLNRTKSSYVNQSKFNVWMAEIIILFDEIFPTLNEYTKLFNIIKNTTDKEEPKKIHVKDCIQILSRIQKEIEEETISNLKNVSDLKNASIKNSLLENPSSNECRNKIFIVHGHDEELKSNVARFVEKLGLEVVILHEMPDQNRSISQKLKDYSDVNFAIILLSPDDEGRKINDIKLNRRARQNVILELGYFYGKLNSSQLCVINKDVEELPSDYDGILFTSYDKDGAWRLKLAKEIKAAGFAVDLNKVL